MKFRRLLSVLLAIAIVASCAVVGGMVVATGANTNVAASGSAYEDMLSKVTPENKYGLSPTVDEGTTLQAWTWSFSAIENNLEKIAEQGFTTVQVSPPNEIKSGTVGKKFLEGDNSNGWWMYYQPAGFQLNQSTNNALGTKAQFVSMCNKAHELGVKVIVDAVINHMGTKDGDDNNTSSDPMSHVTPKAQTFEPEIYNNKLFHSPWQKMTYIESNNTYYNSAYDLTRNCTSGLPDLKTEDQRVQNAIYDYLEELVQAGADGFRFDAAKHIETPDDHDGLGSDFWTDTLVKVQTQHPEKEIYAYGEILNTCGIDRPYSWYTKLFDVTDSGAYWGIKDAATTGGGNATPYYPSTNFTSANTVLWDESHDTYVDGATTSLTTAQRGKIWALVAGRQGISTVYLARPSDATNTNDLYSIPMGEARMTSWSNATTKAINQFHNYFLGQPEYCTANSGGTAYIERGSTGAMIVTLGGTYGKDVNLTNHRLEEGTYIDAITGNTFTVAGNKIKGKVGSTGVACIYENNETPTEAPKETYILGDADTNLKVDIVDAVYVLRYVLEMIELDEKQTQAADVDGDKVVSVIDATFIKRYATEIAVKYPIGTEQEMDAVVPTFNPNNPTTSTQPTTATTPTTTPYPTDSPDPGEVVTIYFSNNKFWSSVNAYMWSDAGESAPWPGEAGVEYTTNEFGEKIYTLSIDTGLYDHVIFNGSGGQTTDVDVAEMVAQGNALYCLDTTDDQGHFNVAFYTYDPNYVAPDPTTISDPTTAPDPSGTTLTLDATFWDKDGARFAAYFFEGSSSTWVSMTGSNGYYTVDAPSGYSSVIFCRMNGSTTENNWDNKWNQTADLKVSDCIGKTCKITGWDSSSSFE